MANLYSFAGPHTVWSTEPQEPQFQNSGARQALGWGTVAAGVAGVVYAGKREWGSIEEFFGASPKGTHVKETGFTLAYRGAKVAEKFALPFGMASTFRIPGFIAPFVQHERIVEASGDLFKPIWSAATFDSEITRKMISSYLGVDQVSMIGAETHGMEWVPNRKGSVLGKMVELKTGKVIQENVRLEQRGGSKEISRLAQAHLGIRSPDVLNEYRHLQDAATRRSALPPSSAADILKGIQDAHEGMIKPTAHSDFFYGIGSEVDKATGNVINHGRHSEFFPVHVPYVNVLGEKGALLLEQGRGVAAAGTGRLNELIRTLEQQVPVLSDLVSKLPFRLYGKEGSAMRNMAMYAGRSSALVAGALVISTASWAKRQSDISGALVFGAAGAYLGSLFGNSWKATGRGAAIAAAASLLPVFKHGIAEGFGGIIAKANQIRGGISNALGFVPMFGSDWRRFWETSAPGSTETSTAIGMGVLGVLGGAILDRRLRPHLSATIDKGAFKNLNVIEALWARSHSAISSSGAEFWNLYGNRKAGGFARPGVVTTLLQRRLEDASWAINELSKQKSWASSGTANVQFPDWMTHQQNLNKSWADSIGTEKHGGRRLWKQIKASWLGAEPAYLLEASEHGGKDWWRKGGLKNIRNWSLPFKSKWSMRAATVAVGWALFTGKVFATSETPQQLEDIYSGKELLPQRKGRWWEGGGTAWEGGAISHFKPHWLPLAKSRAIERSVWGEEESPGGWLDIAPSPVGKLLRKHFTYELEEKHYRDRPYPITGQAFEEVPFLKWILDPIGKIIKPAKLMHVDEWARYNSELGDVELKHVSNSMEIQPAYDLGGIKPGAPDSPFEGKRRFGQFYYQNIVEGPGLWGFTVGSIGQAATGDQVPFTQGSVLQSGGNIDSTTRRFWEMNLGGFGFLSEPVRRFFPRPIGQIGQYNPIANTMPSWIPDELKYGDPYAKISGGEYRLPGVGYAALHEELEGKDPEAYPLVYKYSILADVAPWSDEFREIERSVKWRASEGMFSDEALDFIDRADRQMRTKRIKRESGGYINALNEGAKRGLIGSAIFSLWSGGMNLLHDIFAGPEKILPLGFRPIEKLFPYLSAIQEYEDTVIYGTRFAFWGLKEGWRDWIRPFINQVRHDWFGWNGLPGHIKEVRSMNEYYDKLEFYKWKNLEGVAHEEGDYNKEKLYAKLARRTVTGVNPFDRSATVRAALPKEEQEFFDDFASETNERKRAKILEIVPEYMHKIYEAQWLKADALRTGDEDLNRLVQDWGSTKGEDISSASWSKYQSEAPSWMTYGDFMKINNVQASMDLPSQNWVGFNPAVDIQDVKLKVVMDAGRDIHDVGLWESQQRLLSRKPYLTDEVTSQGDYFNPVSGNDLSTGVFGSQGLDVNSARQLSYPSKYPTHTLDLEIQDSRESEVNNFNNKYGLH